jgi:hypothetical protein
VLWSRSQYSKEPHHFPRSEIFLLLFGSVYISFKSNCPQFAIKKTASKLVKERRFRDIFYQFAVITFLKMNKKDKGKD